MKPNAARVYSKVCSIITSHCHAGGSLNLLVGVSLVRQSQLRKHATCSDLQALVHLNRFKLLIALIIKLVSISRPVISWFWGAVIRPPVIISTEARAAIHLLFLSTSLSVIVTFL